MVGLSTSKTTNSAFSIISAFESMNSVDIWSVIFISTIADLSSPVSSNTAIYVGVDPPSMTKASLTSMFLLFASSSKHFPLSSSPTIVMNFVFTPTLAIFSAMFLHTPPKETHTLPGFESFSL